MKKSVLVVVSCLVVFTPRLGAHEGEDTVEAEHALTLPRSEEEIREVIERNEAWILETGAVFITVMEQEIIVHTNAPDLLPPEIEGIAVRTVPLMEPAIAGKSPTEVTAILNRNRAALKRLPGVSEVGLADEGIAVQTDDPTALPSHVEGIPVIAFPTMGEPINGVPYTQVIEILERNRARLMQIRGVQGIGVGGDGIVVYADYPEVLPATLEGIPVLAAEPMGNPVGELPHTEALKIYEARRAELLALPGAYNIGLGDEAIYLYTTNPEVVPDAVDGLPVKPIVQ
jgi:hypothetical protein